MKKKLYTIPVTEAFDANSECPICFMKKEIESNAIEFTMGPSYMEDDIREATSRLGFCKRHLELLYQNQNRLGLALILKTHMDKTIKDIEELCGKKAKVMTSRVFKKKEENPAAVTYLELLEESCFVCDKIDGTLMRYIETIFHLYQTSEDFHNKFKDSKGFCMSHYKTLYAMAPLSLNGGLLEDFIKELNHSYLDNMKRVRDDLEWFINKFDYRYVNEPWKNSKDALPRSMQKINS